MNKTLLSFLDSGVRTLPLLNIIELDTEICDIFCIEHVENLWLCRANYQKYRIKSIKFLLLIYMKSLLKFLLFLSVYLSTKNISFSNFSTHYTRTPTYKGIFIFTYVIYEKVYIFKSKLYENIKKDGVEKIVRQPHQLSSKLPSPYLDIYCRLSLI